MGKWIIIFAILISGSILGFLYFSLNRHATDGTPLPAVLPTLSSVNIVDGYGDGEHRLSGSIRLPHSCFSINADAQVSSADSSRVDIVVETKDNILEQPICARITTHYPFEVHTSAPENITIRLLVNGSELPTSVTKTNWQSSRGTTFNPDIPKK